MSMATGARTVRTADRVNSITATDWGLLVLRVVLGVIFFAHGGQKVMGWFGGDGLGATVAGFGKMGIPAGLAYLAAFTELLGGAALIIGVLSRFAAVGLAITMIVATVKVHLANGFFLQNQGFEYNLALFGMAVAVVVAGPGRIALGDWEARLFGKHS